MSTSNTSTADLCFTCRSKPKAAGAIYCDTCIDRQHADQERHRERALQRLHGDCPRLIRANWANLTVDEHNRDVVSQAGKWNIDDEFEYDGGIYLWGPCGTGKSHLGFLVATQYVSAGWDETARFVVVRNLLAQARTAMTRGDSNPIDELLAEDISLLVLDDLGAERSTDWARDTIATIVEARYLQTYRPIVVTTNYSPSQLAERLGGDDLLQGQRIVSRLLEDTLVLKLGGPDRRLQVKAA